MPLRRIEQIDFLVHPDYNLLAPSIDPKCQVKPNPNQSELRDRWDQRVADLANDENAFMVYISAFPGSPPVCKQLALPWLTYQPVNPQVLINFNSERMQKYQEKLGERALFYYFELPSSQKLLLDLAEQGFRYDRFRTKKVFYGEYLEVCVDQNSRLAPTILNSAIRGNIQVLPELSYSVKSDPV